MLQAAWLGVAFLVLAPSLGAPDFALGALLAPAAMALLMPQLSLVMNHERNVAQLRASHRKLRHMAELYPEVRVRVLYRRDVFRLLGKYLPEATARLAG